MCAGQISAYLVLKLRKYSDFTRNDDQNENMNIILYNLKIYSSIFLIHGFNPYFYFHFTQNRY